MNKELQLGQKVEFMGVEIVEVSGGFGEGKRGVLAKYIAEVHGIELSNINRNINNNRKRFTDYVDIIDVKQNGFAMHLMQNGIFTNNAINAANNIYLLSERGYAKLIKIMDDDKSWEVHDKLVDDYFQLKEYKENVQIKLEEKDSYTRADELAYKFSVGRTINTFGNADFTELTVLLDEFKEHLDSIKNTMNNGKTIYASDVKKSRYDSMLKGLERMRGQLDIGLSHHVLEQYVQPLTKERYQLVNRQNGGIKASQTKQIQAAEVKEGAMNEYINTLRPPCDTEYATVYRHGFTFNRMYKALPNGDTVKTDEYSRWFTSFPTYQLPDKEDWDVDWDKPILVRFKFITVDGGSYDLDNVIKSSQDVIFDYYGVDDVIIDKGVQERPYFCERIEDGEIRVHISNFN